MDIIGEYDMTDLLTLVVTERAEGFERHARPATRRSPSRRGSPHRRASSFAGACFIVTSQHRGHGARCESFTSDSRAEFLFTFRESQFRVTARREHDDVHSHIHTNGLTMRCSEPGHRVTVAIVASRGPGR